MNDPLDTSENTPEPTSETAKKQPSRARNTVWGLVLAWATILISIVLWSSKTTLMDIFGKTGEISESASEPDSIPDGLLVSLQEEVIGQIAFSLYSLTGDPNSVLQAAPIESIGPAGEVAYAILLGSISGPEKGLESLSKIADSQDPILELLVPAATSALKAAAD